MKKVLKSLSLVCVGFVVGFGSFYFSKVNYCDVCGELSTELDDNNICDYCKGYKEGKTNNEEWHNNY